MRCEGARDGALEWTGTREVSAIRAVKRKDEVDANKSRFYIRRDNSWEIRSRQFWT